MQVSPIGDGAEPRKPAADGYGRSFCILPPEIVGNRRFPTETMLRREARTYSIRPAAPKAASDVNDWMKVKANTGATAAAGAVTGAWLGRSGD